MRILVVNAGSSSLKLSVLDDDELVDEDVLSPGTDQAQVSEFVKRHDGIETVGHRIVHGGTEFTEATLLTEAVVERLHDLTDLAPLHQPKSLSALQTVESVLPGTPAVACFDTAFHATIPPAAHTYALPLEWRRRWPLRRFGFHGLSHAYAAGRAADMAGRQVDDLRTVSCHLGAGASVTAIRDGRSEDTTMGFTPLEGLVMATRSGSVDPGLILWLEQHEALTQEELADALEHRSGLLGLAGSGDMRVVLRAAGDGEPRAEAAIDVYVHRLRSSIASMSAAMGGLDVLLFTGGVGEHAAEIRRRTAAGLGFLGVSVDSAVNQDAEPDVDISAPSSTVRTLVITAREDLQISREVRRLLARGT